MPAVGLGTCFGERVSLCGDSCGRMERWRGRVAAVTGASSGIGAAIAYQLQDAGLIVIGLARREGKIPGAVQAAREAAAARGRAPPAAPAPGALHARRLDVTDERDVAAAFRWIADAFGRLDVLVNNAGVCGNAALTDGATAMWRRVLETNVLGLSVCSREAVQLMRGCADEDGYIVNIGSIVSHMTYLRNDFSMYLGSKHAVKILTEGLRRELISLKSGIKVTCVSPGMVKTDVFEPYDSYDPEEWWSMPHLFPEDIADAVLYALGSPARVQIHEMIVKPAGESF